MGLNVLRCRADVLGTRIYRKVAGRSIASTSSPRRRRVFVVDAALQIRFCEVLAMLPKLTADWLVSLSDVTRSSAIVFSEASRPVDNRRIDCCYCIERLEFLLFRCKPVWPSGKAGEQKDPGSISFRFSLLFKSCGLWTLTCDFVPHN